MFLTDLSYLLDQPATRFDLEGARETMYAVVTIGNGGYEMLDYREVPKPQPRCGEVLLRVLAAGVNNTEINTRLGWYSASVTEGTEQRAEAGEGLAVADGGWNERTPFPFIQGTDCCGEVVAHGDGVSSPGLGTRVLVRACMRQFGFSSLENIWMASDFDGAFAQYVRVPASEVFSVACDWTDEELATLPCAYGTAENMVHRAGVQAGERVLVTGASGGVGSAAVQLCRRRGAQVIAVAGPAKIQAVSELGPEQIVARGNDLMAALGEGACDVVIDNVAGSDFAGFMKILRRGGRYTSSGAIAGPMVGMDMRDFYLKDLTLIGCTAWDEPVFPNLCTYVEQGELKPLVAARFALSEIAQAQRRFMEKSHFGNFVLTPPA